MRGARAGAVVWVLTAQYFVVQVVVAADWSHAYSGSENTISDLGNTRCGGYDGRSVCSPLHTLMNGSFVVLGLTMLAGAVLIGRSQAQSRTATVGFNCMAIAGLGTVVVGVFPENTVAAAHGLGAACPFVLGNAGVILIGAPVRRFPAAVRGLTVLAGIVGLVGLPLFLSKTDVGLGAGGMERVTAYPQDLWVIAIGAYLLTRDGPAVAVGG